MPRVAIDTALVARWTPAVRTLLRQDADGVYYLNMFHLPMFLQRRARIHQHIRAGCQVTQRDRGNRYHWLAAHVEPSVLDRQL
jgi:hypothetical protein